jgi:hypothetical protein
MPSPGDGGAGAADLSRASASCQAATDCRLYSSYCSTAPCQCLAIGRGDVDPPCVGTHMSCIVDPCANERADCSNGRCVAVP